MGTCSETQNEALFGHLRPFQRHLRAEKGKKGGIFAHLEAKWKGDNEENPLRGIETSDALKYSIAVTVGTAA